MEVTENPNGTVTIKIGKPEECPFKEQAYLLPYKGKHQVNRYEVLRRFLMHIWQDLEQDETTRTAEVVNTFYYVWQELETGKTNPMTDQVWQRALTQVDFMNTKKTGRVH